MASRDQRELIREKIRGLLKRRGPLSSVEITRELGITQPSFSRLIATMSDILPIGGGRSRLYALPRTLENYPIVKIGEKAEITALGELRLLQPNGSAFLPNKHQSRLKTEVYKGIPYFVWDIRPQGYLGKIFVSHHPELKLPERWEDWQEADLYRTLKVRGDDLVGDLVIGHESFEQFQKNEPAPISYSKRETEYPRLANDTLQGTRVGSSAGGEQPKFTALIQKEKLFFHVIVKFSPPTKTKEGRRWADLLFAEELALTLLKEDGYLSAQAEAFESEGRGFLQVTRFDRIGRKGRKGTLTLGGIDDEYVGSRSNWTSTALRLNELKLIKKQDMDTIIFLDCFGAHIANSDRHHGNLSLYWELGAKSFALAPVYDMLPMLYAPTQGNIVTREFKKPVMQFEQIQAWKSARTLATKFWQRLTQDKRISPDFRKIASLNEKTLSD